MQPTTGATEAKPTNAVKCITVTYEINIEGMSRERIEELIFQSLDVGFSHNAEMVSLEIEEQA